MKCTSPTSHFSQVFLSGVEQLCQQSRLVCSGPQFGHQTTIFPVKILNNYRKEFYRTMIASFCSNSTEIYVILFKHLQRSMNRIWWHDRVNNGFCLGSSTGKFLCNLRIRKCLTQHDRCAVHRPITLMMLDCVKCKSTFCCTSCILCFSSWFNKILVHFAKELSLYIAFLCFSVFI